MPKTREQKKQTIQELKRNLERQQGLIFLDFQGLGAEQMFNLRSELKQNHCQLKVAKRTLIDLALDQSGFEIDLESMKGQMALIFCFGPQVLPAKIAYKYFKELGSPEILGGFFEGSFWGKDQVIELAQLPSRKELQGQLVSNLRAPIANLQFYLQGPLQRLTLTLRRIQ